MNKKLDDLAKTAHSNASCNADYTSERVQMSHCLHLQLGSQETNSILTRQQMDHSRSYIVASACECCLLAWSH